VVQIQVVEGYFSFHPFGDLKAEMYIDKLIVDERQWERSQLYQRIIVINHVKQLHSK